MKCKQCSMEGKYEVKNGDQSGFYCEHHVPKKETKTDTDVNKKSIIPLFVVILGIVLLSLIRQVTQGVNSMAWMMDFMGFFLLVFGLFKLYDLRGFVSGFVTYDIVAKKSLVYAYLYPFMEVGLGIMYLLGYMFVWQNTVVLAFSVLGMFSAYLVLRKREKITCVCLGTVFNLPMTWVTFIENAFMGIMVVLMLSWGM